MTVWKSPVLYIGVILVLAVAGALLAPFVIDWNSYRADLENYGRKLTGRSVTIDGPISVRLFPWPSLTASDVHIANPPGLDEKDFASAATVTARMQLAGLFSGEVQVESIAIDQPVVVFERMPSGAGNWWFRPLADLAQDDLLGRIRLDRITLNDATVRLIDRRRGSGEIDLKVPLAALASPGIAGPWRLKANSVEASGRSFAVNIGTAVWKEGEPFRFSLHVADADGAGLAYNFDGAETGDRIAGEFRIEPAAEPDGKADAEGQLRPLVLRSKLVANFDALALDSIEVAPRDPRDGGTLVSGSARLALGAHISAETDLTAGQLDLEHLAGARANQVLRQGGGLAVAEAFLAMLPEAVDLKGSLKVTSLKVGGETLDNVALRIEANREAIRVRELSADLPGRSRALFNEGIFFPGKEGAQLAGKLAVESNDLRQLASWVWPEGKEGIARLWTGSRGRLKMQTDINLTPTHFRLARTQYEIDGVPGSGELSVTLASPGFTDLRINADKLDIDNFSPGGIAAAPEGGKSGLAALVTLLVPHEGARDLRLVVRAGQLLLNGVTASDVTVDLTSGPNGLDLRGIDIGSVGGARLEANGLILDTGNGADGSIGIDVNAGDPRGLLRLLGLIPVDREPAWSKALGATALKGTITVKPAAAGPVAGFDLSGTTGDFALAASGTVKGVSGPGPMTIGGSVDLKAPSSGALASLAGFIPAVADQTPSRVKLTGTGNFADGFLTDLSVEAYGARLGFNGMAGGKGGLSAVDGKLSLRTTEAMPLLAAIGLPLATLPSGVMVLDSSLKSNGTAFTLPDLAGRFGGARLDGNITLGEGGRIAANIDAGGDMMLGDLLAATFLAWNGLAPESDSNFATGLPLGLTGEIWIKPENFRVDDTFTAKDAQIGITASPDEIRLAMFGKDDQGRNAAIEIASLGTDSNRALDGKFTLPFDLARQLRLAGGATVADGNGLIDLHFEAKGRSPGGAISAMKGSGSYSVKGLRLVGISPASFTAALSAATDAAGLTAAFDALRGDGAGLAGGDITGSITIENGIAAFLPFTIQTPDADATVKVVAEPANAAIDASVELSLKARAGLPAMEISYAGPPSALARNEDKAELASKLGFGMMQQGVAELERLQREQLRLAAEEEKLRKEDEAKLQAHYAQRDEIRLRQRELKVHSEMRVRAAEALRLKIESERAANAEINKSEIKQRVRELRIHRRMARLERQAREPEPAQKPAPRPRPQTQVPVILVPPSEPPSQQ